MLAGDREESKLYLTIFILWGVESLYITLLVNASSWPSGPREDGSLLHGFTRSFELTILALLVALVPRFT